MTPAQEVDYILDDCFLAVGQTVGTEKTLDFDVIPWLRTRYRAFFLNAMIQLGNSWAADRARVTAVGRFLGQRALFHAGAEPVISLAAVRKASAEVESGCRMNAIREGASRAARRTPRPAVTPT
jgi:hypothetical protein